MTRAWSELDLGKEATDRASFLFQQGLKATGRGAELTIPTWEFTPGFYLLKQHRGVVSEATNIKLTIKHWVWCIP